MSTPLVEVRDLVTTFAQRGHGLSGLVGLSRRPRVRAVDGVSLQVAAGELLALVGESGCGKTTTAQSLLKLVPIDSGRLLLDGADITETPPKAMRKLRRRMQLIYQDPYEALDPRFRVRETLEEPLLIHGLGNREERARRIEDALATVGLTPPSLFLERYPHEMSGGQRQRVAIASALVLEPDVLVADEPVSMLDVSVRAGVLALLDQLRRERGLAVIMITHDLSTAARFADRIAVMYLGRIVEEGAADQVVRNPRHPYTQALLSVVPQRDPRARLQPIVLTGEPPDATAVPSGCRFHPRCPVVLPACRELDPELTELADLGHRAACLRTEPAFDPAQG